MITRNRLGAVIPTLERLVSLPERPPIVVVDNGSSDATVATIEERFPSVQVIALASNRGGAARNVGVAAAGTPYVAFADDDSWWAPGSLARAADILDQHPRLALLNAHILVNEEERDDPICLEMAQTPLAPIAGQPGYPLLSFIACAAVVRRAAFEQGRGLPARAHGRRRGGDPRLGPGDRGVDHVLHARARRPPPSLRDTGPA